MKAPAFQFYVQDFLTGTMHLSAEEIGAYILLLCHQWDKGALPATDKDLLRIARTKMKTLEVVKEKFAVGEDGLLRNERLEREREKQAQWRLKSAEAGKKSGEVRRTKMNQPSLLVETKEEPTANSSPSSSTSVSTTDVNNKTCVGNQFYDGKADEVLMMLCAPMVQQAMMTQFRELETAEVFSRLNQEKPAGYHFTNTNHLFNAFNQIAKVMLEEKKRSLKNNQNGGKRKPGSQHRTHDYSQWKRG